MELSDFQPAKELPKELIQTPSFLTGSLAETFFPKYEQARQGNQALGFKETRNGSNPLITGLVNKVFADNEGKFRTPVPTDDIYKDIYSLIRDEFHTDLNALDVWQEKPAYKRNQEIWEQAIELAKQEGVTEFPFRIQGFYCLPDSSKESYQIKIEQADNFRVISDKRLSLPTGTKFDSLDENGMIIPNENGKFTKYTLRNGLSRVCLNGYGYLNSNGDNLANSNDIGRVVVVDAEGVV